MAMPDPEALVRREQRASAAINGVLSALFFALVFGLPVRALSMGDPDGFAVDWLPQGGMVSLMAALVPSLLVRARLRREGREVAAATVLRGVGLSLLAGLASAGVLALACAAGPWAGVDWFLALALKLAYGATLGAGVTGFALRTLLRRATTGGIA